MQRHSDDYICSNRFLAVIIEHLDELYENDGAITLFLRGTYSWWLWILQLTLTVVCVGDSRQSFACDQ